MTSARLGTLLIHKILSFYVTMTNAARQIFMMTEEGGPRAVTVIMTTAGIGWYVTSDYYSCYRQT